KGPIPLERFAKSQKESSFPEVAECLLGKNQAPLRYHQKSTTSWMMLNGQREIRFRFFRSPALWGILAASLLALPGIPSYDFQVADYTHVAVLSGVISYPGMSVWNLYHFADGIPEHNLNLISRNYLPWFTSPHWKFSFCRHIPSLLIAIHYQIFGLWLPS